MRAIQEFNSTFKPNGLSDEDAMKDPVLSPGDAPAGWWKNAPVEKILVTVGEWEIFRDDCVEVRERLEYEIGTETKVEFVKARKSGIAGR